MLIQNLNSAGALSDADLVPIQSAGGASSRKMSLGTLATFLQTELTGTDDKKTQYAAPLTGATVRVAPAVDGGGVFLLITPLGTLAALTVQLPASDHAIDKQQVLVLSTQQITTLTIDGNGATVNGAPGGMVATGSVLFRFDAVLGAWFSIQPGQSFTLEQVQDAVAAMLVAGTHIDSIVYDDTAGTVTINAATQGGGGGGMTNPMTTAGDLIVGGSGGTPERLAKGTDGDVLTMAAGVEAWTPAAGLPAGDISEAFSRSLLGI